MKIKKSTLGLLVEYIILKTLGESVEDTTKRKMIVLVGPPSVGKSMWIKSNFPDAYIINRDDIVDNVAESLGFSYDDMFANPAPDAEIGDHHDKYGTVIASPKWMKWTKTVFEEIQNANAEVQKQMNSRVSGAHSSGKDIVVDMTNLTAGARRNALKAINNNSDEYHKVAVDFKFKGAEEIIKKMANKRAEEIKRAGKSKTIPSAVFDRMFRSYEEPTKAEGFDEIISIDNIGNLKKALGNN